MTKHVLLVFDDFLESQNWQSLFEKSGCRVESIRNDASLAPTMLAFKPDIIFILSLGLYVTPTKAVDKIRAQSWFQGKVIILESDKRPLSSAEIAYGGFDGLIPLSGMDDLEKLAVLSEMLDLDYEELSLKYESNRLAHLKGKEDTAAGTYRAEIISNNELSYRGGGNAANQGQPHGEGRLVEGKFADSSLDDGKRVDGKRVDGKIEAVAGQTSLNKIGQGQTEQGQTGQSQTEQSISGQALVSETNFIRGNVDNRNDDKVDDKVRDNESVGNAKNRQSIDPNGIKKNEFAGSPLIGAFSEKSIDSYKKFAANLPDLEVKKTFIQRQILEVFIKEQERVEQSNQTAQSKTEFQNILELKKQFVRSLLKKGKG